MKFMQGVSENRAIGQDPETKTETQANLAVAHDDSVAFSGLPRRQSRAGLAPPGSELGGRRGSSVFGIKRDHFAPGGKQPVDRPKPFSHVHLRRVVDPDLGGGALRRPRQGDSGVKATCSRAGFRAWFNCVLL